jgi:membrane protease subunit (stomatin/prohibitin family)
MDLFKKNAKKSRWIGSQPLKAGELLRQSSQIKDGLTMGMRLAVLEEQAAAVVAEGRLVSVFLPGAYHLEQDKMPPLKPDEKYDWLYPAQLYFLNMAPAPTEPWRPQEPLLTRDPERGLVELSLAGEYDAQVENAVLFMQSLVLERGFQDWPALHRYLSYRLNELAISMMAHNRTAIARLDKMKEKTALFLRNQINLELHNYGLTLLSITIHNLEVHPQMHSIWQEQNEHLAYNLALSRSILIPNS